MLIEYRGNRPQGYRMLRTPLLAPPRLKHYGQLGWQRIDTMVFLTNLPADVSEEVIYKMIIYRAQLCDAPEPLKMVMEPTEDGSHRALVVYASPDDASRGSSSLRGVALLSAAKGLTTMRVTSLDYQRTRYNKLGFMTDEMGAIFISSH